MAAKQSDWMGIGSNWIAYLECTGVHYDPQKYNLSDFRYDMVILLPPWKAIYTKDKERNESFDEAENLYFYIRNTYQKNNIPIVEIPFQCPEVRISNLLKYLDDEKTGWLLTKILEN